MDPLSPLTYIRRHKKSVLLLAGLICLATMGLYIMVAVLDSIPMRAQSSYLTRVSRVYPTSGSDLEPAITSQIQTHPDIERAIPDNGLDVSVPTLIGVDGLHLMGVSPADAQYLIDHYGVRLGKGRLFEPRTNEIVLSEQVARALGLQVGDQVDRSVNDVYYGAIPDPLVVVGILESNPTVPGPSIRVGFASYEYLSRHESYAPRQTGLLVVAREGHKEAVDEFLESTSASGHTGTETFAEIAQWMSMGRQGLYVLFGVVNCVVAVVVALVVGVINRIAMMRRLTELGLLNAIGHHKGRLIRRMTLETVSVAGTAWVVGLALALVVLSGLKSGFYYARGMDLNLANLAPFWFALPTPIVVVSFAALSATRVFSRLDAIAIVEQGKLSTEPKGPKHAAKRSSSKPLSSRTFYWRHRRRGVMLVLSMALMITGIAFPIFLLSASADAMLPDFEYLRYVSEVTSRAASAIDPGITAQLRSHSAVAHVVQTIPVWLHIVVPPGGGTQVNIYGVREPELPELMALFELQVTEGRLPRARSNEIVIPRAAALNRGLRIGDTVGRPAQERREDADADPMIEDSIPTEMVVVGLLDRDDLWIGFASLEYLESHELTASRPSRLLVIPADGRKGELDTWLEESVASAQANVVTYDALFGEFRQAMQGMFMLFAAVEGIIALVAAIALAALNHVFFAQRREEFGILHAVGHSRPWLVLRTTKETASTVSVAWLLGTLVCVIGLVSFWALVYVPRGLSLNFFNLTPWLFTLPIPLAVIAVGAGTIARTLSRLDPLAVIEGRQA